MTELTLPDGLKTIGESAFARGTDSPNRYLEELTIPASVESIGAEAFINYHELQTVKVLGSETRSRVGGSGPSQLKEVGLAAFGNAAHNSHTEQGTITHPEHPELTYSGQVGTEFYLPQEVDPDLFTSGVTCYTGDIPPLTYHSTKEPTCTEAGYYRYVQYIPGWEVDGNPVPLYIDVTIPATGHDWELSKPFPASCESDAYELWVCANDNTHTQNRVPETPSLATDHNYTLTVGTGAALGSGAVTFTWECQQPGHDEDRDGGKPQVVNITVNPAALEADTGMTYGDLTLPKVEGGALSLAESVDRDALLTTSVTTVPVVFTPNFVTYAGYTGMGPVDNLTLAIQVEKAVLDFSGVRFENCIADVNPEADPGTAAPGIQVSAAGLPDDVTAGKPVYQSGTSGYGPSETPPPINATWDGTVSVTFTYDTAKYQVDESKVPPIGEYTPTFGDGTVTITHSYRIVTMDMTDLKGRPLRA